MPSVEVSCGGGQVHVIDWSPSRGLVLLGHPGERDDDDVLVALSRAPARCRSIEDAWRSLDPVRALEFLSATPSQLEAIARRLPPALDQRERVRHRDDLHDDQRAAAIRGFDQMAALAEVAGLGPALARARAVEAAGVVWRDRRLRRSRPARVAVTALLAGSLPSLLPPGPLRAAVGWCGGRAIRLVPLRWVLHTTAPQDRAGAATPVPVAP